MSTEFQPGDRVRYYRAGEGVRSHPATIVKPAKPSRSGWTRFVIELDNPDFTRCKRIVACAYALVRAEATP